MDSRLPVKTSQALAEHVVTHHFFFSTLTNAFEQCEGNILIRLDSTGVNEDQSTSTVDTSISEVEKGLPMSCPGTLTVWLLKMYFNMIFHLKNDILSSATHPNIFLNMFDFFLLLKTKDSILKNIPSIFHTSKKDIFLTSSKIKGAT